MSQFPTNSLPVDVKVKIEQDSMTRLIIVGIVVVVAQALLRKFI